MNITDIEFCKYYIYKFKNGKINKTKIKVPYIENNEDNIKHLFSFCYWNTKQNLSSFDEYENNQELKIDLNYFINIIINYVLIKEYMPEYKIRLYIYDKNIGALFYMLNYVFKNIDNKIFDKFEIISCLIKSEFKIFDVGFIMSSLRFMPIMENNTIFHSRDMDFIFSPIDYLITKDFENRKCVLYTIRQNSKFINETNPFLAGMIGGNTSVETTRAVNKYLDSFYNYYKFILLYQAFYGKEYIEKYGDISLNSYVIDEFILARFFSYIKDQHNSVNTNNLYYSYGNSVYLNKHIIDYFENLATDAGKNKCTLKLGKKFDMKLLFTKQTYYSYEALLEMDPSTDIKIRRLESTLDLQQLIAKIFDYDYDLTSFTNMWGLREILKVIRRDLFKYLSMIDREHNTNDLYYNESCPKPTQQDINNEIKFMDFCENSSIKNLKKLSLVCEDAPNFNYTRKFKTNSKIMIEDNSLKFYIDNSLEDFNLKKFDQVNSKFQELFDKLKSLSGGFYYKYLKYKNKYLNLRQLKN